MHWFRYVSAQIGLTEISSASIPAGMIADATIIAAPSSTKNAAAAREPEMQQTKKGQQWGAIDGHAKRHRDRKDPARYSCQSSSRVTPTRRSLAWMRTQPHCGKRTELFYEYETFRSHPPRHPVICGSEQSESARPDSLSPCLVKGFVHVVDKSKTDFALLPLHMENR